MKKKPSKKLTLSKETLSRLGRLVQGGTQWSDPIVCGGGGGDPSAGFVNDPNACDPRG